MVFFAENALLLFCRYNYKGTLFKHLSMKEALPLILSGNCASKIDQVIQFCNFLCNDAAEIVLQRQTV